MSNNLREDLRKLSGTTAVSDPDWQEAVRLHREALRRVCSLRDERDALAEEAEQMRDASRMLFWGFLSVVIVALGCGTLCLALGRDGLIALSWFIWAVTAAIPLWPAWRLWRGGRK